MGRGYQTPWSKEETTLYTRRLRSEGISIFPFYSLRPALEREEDREIEF